MDYKLGVDVVAYAYEATAPKGELFRRLTRRVPSAKESAWNRHVNTTRRRAVSHASRPPRSSVNFNISSGPFGPY